MAENIGDLSEKSLTCKVFTWKISNFGNPPLKGRYSVKSPEFVFANAIWYLQLYSRGDVSEQSEFVSMQLVRSQSSVPAHLIDYSIGFKTYLGEEYKPCSVAWTFDNMKGQWGHSHDYRLSQIAFDWQLLYLLGELTVFCDMRMKEEATPEACFRPQQHRNEPSQTELKDAYSQTEVLKSVTRTEVEEASVGVQKLQLDYSQLLESEEDSDVCLKVSGKEFRAHKCILRARSKVFAAIFKYGTEKEASGEVVIDDLDPDSFPDFLQHVYSGRLDGLSDENVFNLYLAADKYDLQELKWDCWEYMKQNLSVDNFCDVMIDALKHEEEELLKMATDFFSMNFAEILATVNWQRFLTDHPTEANQLLIQSFLPRKKN